MKNIVCHDFAGDSAALIKLVGSGVSGAQATYLSSYLERLSLSTIVEEKHYFDRDFLAEYAAFYCASAREYSNRCRRLHFFSCIVTTDTLKQLAAGDATASEMLDKSYLGFTVIRPIAAKFGRTVVRWYPDSGAGMPRNVNPSRDYHAHLLGHRFTVRGLAWQQQDGAVGACATIALWSMLHSSAFDDHHAIPTTADITQYAHKTASLGARVFPSTGLNLIHILEAIKGSGLAPACATPDMKTGNNLDAMSRDKFTSTCAALVRSGYPALVAGRLRLPHGSGLHAVCVTGFREPIAPLVGPSDPVQFQDKGIEHVYIHDDNIGPNVRFAVSDSSDGVMLAPSSPNGSSVTPSGYGPFFPMSITAAMHEGIRTSPTDILVKGLDFARDVQSLFVAATQAVQSLGAPIGVSVSARFCKAATYLGKELDAVCGNKQALSQVRMSVIDDASPMCLHLGVIRIGTSKSLVMDVVCDTTDSTLHPHVFCCIVFDPRVYAALSAISLDYRLLPAF